jgi:hypothetical protein
MYVLKTRVCIHVEIAQCLLSLSSCYVYEALEVQLADLVPEKAPLGCGFKDQGSIPWPLLKHLDHSSFVSSGAFLLCFKGD